MKKLLVFLMLFLFLAMPSAFATKIADTMMTGVSTKTDLPSSSVAASDKIPVYDDTAAAWKTVEAVEFDAGVPYPEETVIAAGAVSVTVPVSHLDASAGAGTITLAAPAANMDGKVKIIEYTGGGTNALTMALTNVVGGTAATTASFNADNETLTLVGGENKWIVTGQAGVTLS